MSITNLKRNIANIKLRRSDVYVIETDGSGAEVARRNVGEIRDARLSWTPLTTSRSTRGGQRQYGADITLTFTMMQTSNEEFGAIPRIAAEDPSRGTTLLFTEGPTDPTGGGFLIKGAAPVVEATIDLGGGESALVWTVTGYVSMEQLSALGTPSDGTDGYNAGERVLILSR